MCVPDKQEQPRLLLRHVLSVHEQILTSSDRGQQV
jgi:hypothetical protein